LPSWFSASGQAHLDQFHLHRAGIKRIPIDRKKLLRKRHYELSQIAVCERSAENNWPKASDILPNYEFNCGLLLPATRKVSSRRERFEEIVRSTAGTPVAAKSLFFLGESYRKEKNNVKAILAYEALLQYYPESKFAPEAKTYLTQLEKEKQDPLAMLLMRDRRPATTAREQLKKQQITRNSKTLPSPQKPRSCTKSRGEEKSIFRRGGR